MIQLSIGQKIPSDCILLEGYQVIVDESIFTGNPRPVKKEILTPDNLNRNPNPFLFCGSVIKGGFGLALVCAVGNSTFKGQQKERLEFEKPTPTQKKLKNIAN